jgi:hypothetical protein
MRAPTDRYRSAKAINIDNSTPNTGTRKRAAQGQPSGKHNIRLTPHRRQQPSTRQPTYQIRNKRHNQKQQQQGRSHGCRRDI